MVWSRPFSSERAGGLICFGCISIKGLVLVCFIFNKFVFVQSLVHSNANSITKGLKKRTSLYSIYDDQIVEKIQANKERNE